MASLNVLSSAEKQRMIVDWNDTAAEYPRHSCIHELVEEQARRTPQAIAVRYGQEMLTYGQLDSRSSRLAAALAERGVGPERLAALCTGRSATALVALLAILKAGGAVVPLDPEGPEDRLAFMLEDSDPVLILADEPMSGRLQMVVDV